MLRCEDRGSAICMIPCGFNLLPHDSDKPKRDARDLNGEPGVGGALLSVLLCKRERTEDAGDESSLRLILWTMPLLELEGVSMATKLWLARRPRCLREDDMACVPWPDFGRSKGAEQVRRRVQDVEGGRSAQAAVGVASRSFTSANVDRALSSGCEVDRERYIAWRLLRFPVAGRAV